MSVRNTFGNYRYADDKLSGSFAVFVAVSGGLRPIPNCL